MDLEILHDYLVESKELLQKAQEDTLRLESEPDDQEALASIFRAFHTIKGGAAFLEAVHLVEWAHDLEDLLEKLRSHCLPVTRERIDAILGGIDVIDSMFEELAREQAPRPGPAGMSDRIRMLAMEGSGTEASEVDRQIRPVPVLVGTRPEQAGIFGAEITSRAAESASASPARISRAVDPVSEEELGGKPGQAAHAPDPWSPVQGGAAAQKALAGGAESAEKMLRVDAARLDAVMNQVGELVLLRNRLTSALGSMSTVDENMTRIAREMDLRVSDLQSSVMSLRMQPCRRLFQQLPRVVRDASRQLGKTVQLEIAGEEVEIDKTVVDALSGPIVHLVRNSLDHGIELPDLRKRANKPVAATLRIAAVHLGDRVRIEVSDDGNGIDRNLVVRKAVEKGVITQDEAAHLSDHDALELIFRPGFSTRDQASELSGRGVGMDVVKQTTDRLRGRLSINTQPGQGTTISMEFPLTLAVLPVLYLRVRQEIYALPISAIDSLADLEEHRVHRLANRVSYRVDGTQTVPLVDLGAVLQNRPLRLGAESVEGVLTERGLFAVSEVLGNEDSVVKPIDFLSAGNLYQGATISGAGNVVLILDAGALSAAAGAAAERGQ
ncbi:MAG TPA: chemotaxis protein CheA [Terracidiphilus sp.]|nr:chemotaxis protein CheA [Terracidiphilus sp.]